MISFVSLLAFMWFTKGKTVETVVEQTPLEQLEQLRQVRRDAKAEYDGAWKELQHFLNTHPPIRRPFALDHRVYVPVNLLKDVSAEQRSLENKVFRSRGRWSELQKQESDMEFALRLKR
jgi:hypothetical protein